MARALARPSCAVSSKQAPNGKTHLEKIWDCHNNTGHKRIKIIVYIVFKNTETHRGNKNKARKCTKADKSTFYNYKMFNMEIEYE